MGGEQRRLAAIVVADVVGYSRLMGRDESGTVARLRQVREQHLAPILARRGGRIVKLTGDGAILEFGSAVESVAAAIEFQQAMRVANQDLPTDDALAYRVGVHLGDLIIDDTDLYGDGLNVAARLESEAPTAGVLVSGAIHEAVAGRLKAAFKDRGPLALKNIERPVSAFEVSWNATDWTSAQVSAGAAASAPQMAATAALPLPDKPSIAVLPFQNMSGDPEQEYFSDGISEDIITALSRFRSFHVTARSSTFSYKKQAVDLKKVGAELGVQYVLEGSVRKGGNRVRITAQLIEAETGNHVWADRYDRDLVDIFAVQDEITESIVGAIEQQVGSIERVRAVHQRPDNLKAWDLFQRGMFYVYQMTREGLANGADLLRQSLERDPTFAEAHAWLAFAYLHQVYLNTAENITETVAAALEHTKQAVRHDEHLSLSHEMLARIHIFDRRYDEAVAAAKRAVELNPNSSSAHFSLGVILIFADRHAEALKPTERAMRLSPKDHRRANHLNSMGIILGETGRLTESVERLRETVSLPHGDYRSALWLARYAAEAGLMDEARRAAAVVMKLNPTFSLSRIPSTFGAFFHPDYLARFMPHIVNLGFPT